MHTRPLFAALLLSLFALTACGDTATLRIVAAEPSAHQGSQALRARDFDSILLNVVAVRVHVVEKDEEGKKKGRWHDLLQEEDKPFVLDLIRLLDGELTQLAEGGIPAGKLTQLRFVLDSRDPGTAYRADTWEEMPVRVPSGTTSGLKIKGKPIWIEEGQTRELLVDFDLRASLREEKKGTLWIRPVIHLRKIPTEAY